VYDVASRRGDAEFELVDLRDYPLPHLDEPLPPSMGQYQNEHTRQWATRSPHSTDSSSSPPSTTTAPPECSRTPSTLLDQVVAWSAALAPLRQAAAAAA
jgi:hypothetical protein